MGRNGASRNIGAVRVQVGPGAGLTTAALVLAGVGELACANRKADAQRRYTDARTGLKALRNNPGLQIVRPPPVPTPGLDNIAPPNKPNPTIRHAKSPSHFEDLMTDA